MTNCCLNDFNHGIGVSWRFEKQRNGKWFGLGRIWLFGWCRSMHGGRVIQCPRVEVVMSDTVARSSDRFDWFRREDVDALRLPTRRSSPRNSLHSHDCCYQPRSHAMDLTTRVSVPASNRSNSQEQGRCNLNCIENVDEVHKVGFLKPNKRRNYKAE